ncbi:hypothetical protein T261_8080 [Streptomyces lydicus]|nr:hypothetical protein T261_8080 [Streptomyces lydicus]
MSVWEGVRLAIVVDTAYARPGRPGHVHRQPLGSGLPHTPRGTNSSHGFALGDTVRLARALDRLPGQLLVYAVEAADTSPGTRAVPAGRGRGRTARPTDPGGPRTPRSGR